VGAAAATLAAWRPESDHSLGLPESASETSGLLSSRVVVATAAEVSHIAVLAAPAEHVSLLCAYCLTSAECNHTSELILQILQPKKRVYNSSTILNR
jgi:TctA family transporter